MLIPSKKRDVLRSVWRIVGVYLGAALLWVLVSDAVIASIATNEAVLVKMQTYKGIVFVVVTAAILYFVLRRQWSLRAGKEEQVYWQAELLNITHHAVIVRKWADGRITFWNRGAEKLYGWTAEEAVGGLSHEMLYNGNANAQRDQSDWALVVTGAWRGKRIQKRKDGSELIVDAHLTLVRDATGELDSVLCINRDITMMEGLKNPLQRADGEISIGEPAGAVCHESNNPVGEHQSSAPGTKAMKVAAEAKRRGPRRRDMSALKS